MLNPNIEAIATAVEIRQAQFLQSVKLWPTVHQIMDLTPLMLSTTCKEEIEDEIYIYLQDQISLPWLASIKMIAGNQAFDSTFWLINNDEINNDSKKLATIILPIKPNYKNGFNKVNNVLANRIKLILAQFWARTYSDYVGFKLS